MDSYFDDIDEEGTERIVHISTSSQTNHLKAPKEKKIAESHLMDIIEFEAVEYICYETDKYVELAVTREGNSSLEPIVLKWKTVNTSTERSFIPLNGEILFKKGEKRKTFPLDVIWTFNEFSVESLVDVTLDFQDNEFDNIIFGGHHTLI